MRSEEARRLADSVEVHGGEGHDDDDDRAASSQNAWNRMGTSLSQKLPSKKGARRSSSHKESLVRKKKTTNKKTATGAVGEESIYDRAEREEALSGGDDDDDAESGDEDAFLDAPLRDPDGMLLRPADVADLPRPLGALALGLQGTCLGARRCAKAAHRRLYGDAFPWDDFVRTLALSSTLFVMIGGYWLLRSLKDVVLTALCGVESIPRAKMLSVFVVLGVVAFYNHLLDERSGFRKHQLFYVFGTFYGVLFAGIAYFLGHPTIGLANQVEDPGRILGWVSYCGIESFGSVMVSLFWSFANSSFNLKQAKRSFGMMVAVAQLGSILGPTFVNQLGDTVGIPACYMVGASCMFSLQATIWCYVKMYGGSEDASATEEAGKKTDPKQKNKAGILEGLHLFVEHNYVKGIFAISCLFMVEVTIVDYTMKLLARDHFSTEFPCAPLDAATGAPMSCWDVATNSADGMSAAATEAFTTFMGLFGMATNALSFCLSFFGTSAVIRHLGLRTTLVLFPSLCLAVIVTVRAYPTLNVVFAAMMILKASSYALNNPTKEMLYQPTSSNVKYKAKSWIDIFGARGSKALGSVVTNAFSSSASELIHNGSIVGMAVASFLIWNARFMGKKFEEYTETGYVVGGTNDEGRDATEYSEVGETEGRSDTMEMAGRQNEAEDTSCAFHDDDELSVEEEGQAQSETGVEDGIEFAKSPKEKHLVELV